MTVVRERPFAGSSIHLVFNALGLDVVTLRAFNGLLLDRNPIQVLLFLGGVGPHMSHAVGVAFCLVQRCRLITITPLGLADAPDLESKYRTAVIALCSSNALSRKRMWKEENGCTICGRPSRYCATKDKTGVNEMGLELE